ncbi:MAG: hypothetical protein IH886_14105 [Nitrospinae bacterium]|nr:hypothetical protein [Nitrospinota bacterium]
MSNNSEVLDKRFRLAENMGPVHSWWIKNPMAFSYLLIGAAIGVSLFSWILNVWSTFGNGAYKGFNDYWFYIVFFGLPIGTLLIAFYLRQISEAIFSLNKIVLSQSNGGQLYSDYLFEKISKYWGGVFWGTIFLLIILVGLADVKDILSPITDWHSEEKDWSNKCHTLDNNKYACLTLNLLVFSLEGLLGYCGLIILPFTFFVKYWVVEHVSELEKARKEKIAPKGTLSKFKVNWDWDDPKGRCGLWEWDKLVFHYLILVLIVFVFISISIIYNLIAHHNIDTGNWELIIVAIFYFPGMCYWVMFPYLKNFPEDSPEGKQKPNKNPLGWPKFGMAIRFLGGYWFILLSVSLYEIGINI